MANDFDWQAVLDQSALNKIHGQVELALQCGRKHRERSRELGNAPSTSESRRFLHVACRNLMDCLMQCGLKSGWSVNLATSNAATATAAWERGIPPRLALKGSVEAIRALADVHDVLKGNSYLHDSGLDRLIVALERLDCAMNSLRGLELRIRMSELRAVPEPVESFGSSRESPQVESDASQSIATILQYVTLNQAAGLVQRHKDTLGRWLRDDPHSPMPAIEGGGGKPHEYLWSEMRRWLESKSGRQLPERFPSS